MALSQFEIIQGVLADPNVNWIRVDYFKRAKCDMAAAFRLKTGETVATGGIKKAHFMSGRCVSSQSPSLLLTMAREAGSRNEDDAYDYRSMILAALQVGGGIEQNVSEIAVNYNFKQGFHMIPLCDAKRIFPEFQTPEAEIEWASHFLNLQKMKIEREALKKQMASMKAKIDKKAVASNGTHEFFYQPPTGETDSVVDGSGNKVPTVCGSAPYLTLELAKAPEVKVERYGILEVIKLHLRIEELSTKVKDLTAYLRPYELGIIERIDGDRTGTFMVGGISLKLCEGFEKGNYQHSPETMKKIETGEYKIVKTPVTKGKWICRPVSAKGTVEMTQSETAEV